MYQSIITPSASEKDEIFDPVEYETRPREMVLGDSFLKMQEVEIPVRVTGLRKPVRKVGVEEEEVLIPYKERPRGLRKVSGV